MRNTPEESNITNNSLQESLNSSSNNNESKTNGNIEIGTTEERGFIIDNVFHSETYFTSQGMQDEHAGLGLFAYDEDIMNWVFSKSK